MNKNESLLSVDGIKKKERKRRKIKRSEKGMFHLKISTSVIQLCPSGDESYAVTNDILARFAAILRIIRRVHRFQDLGCL